MKTMTISKIRNIIPTFVGYTSEVSRNLGHWYEKGTMYAKHIVGLALGSIFRCSDKELPDELESRGLLKPLKYKNPPDPSIFSKVRKEVGEEKIGRTAELIIHELYKGKFVSLYGNRQYFPTILLRKGFRCDVWIRYL